VNEQICSHSLPVQIALVPAWSFPMEI
jgi:hypothetical protein